MSGEKLVEDKVKFEEATTIRPDGGCDVAYASGLNQDVIPPKQQKKVLTTLIATTH